MEILGKRCNVNMCRLNHWKAVKLNNKCSVNTFMNYLGQSLVWYRCSIVSSYSLDTQQLQWRRPVTKGIRTTVWKILYVEGEKEWSSTSFAVISILTNKDLTDQSPPTLIRFCKKEYLCCIDECSVCLQHLFNHVSKAFIYVLVGNKEKQNESLRNHRDLEKMRNYVC